MTPVASTRRARFGEIERGLHRHDPEVAAHREAIGRNQAHAARVFRDLHARLDASDAFREALLERLDLADRREAELCGQVEALAASIRSVGGQIPSIAALGWDALAMSRRLAVLEDRTEAMLQHQEDSGGTPSLVAYPQETKAAG